MASSWTACRRCPQTSAYTAGSRFAAAKIFATSSEGLRDPGAQINRRATFAYCTKGQLSRDAACRRMKSADGLDGWPAARPTAAA
jgi:hypothetical protein